MNYDNSAIQALATGLPCVTTDHSGFSDQIIHGKNGYLAKEASPEDIAKYILKYLNEPESWGSMSEVARKTMLERYDSKPLITKQAEYYEKVAGKKVKNVAFVTEVFPAISETFIINQIADLLDMGIDVQVFAFRKGSSQNVSKRFFEYNLENRAHYMQVPDKSKRIIPAIMHFFRLAAHPTVLFRALNFFSHGRNALSGKLLFWAVPFLNLKTDIVHCHFGTTANRYLILKNLIPLKQPIITTFYGYDVSSIPKTKGAGYYDGLKRECSQFFVMSNNMKQRVAALGFEESKLAVLPISIQVASFPFAERSVKPGEKVQMISVGRFVEKKGFDDLLRAVALVKLRTTIPFEVRIVGGGKNEKVLKLMSNELGLDGIVQFVGFKQLEEVISMYMGSHLYIQTSKTASDGDME